MTPHLEAKLAQDFTSFFVGRSKSITETRMAEGCACDDGWYEIIHDFCYLTKASLHCARYVLSRDGERVFHVPPEFEFVQIKEKMGSLRLYYRLWQPEADAEGKDFKDIDLRLGELKERINGFSSYAHLLSLKTCELTGTAGKIRIHGGQFKTLSKEKAVELGFEDLPHDRPLNG